MRVNEECARMLNRLVMALKISSGKCLWASNRERIERRLRAARNSIKQIKSDCNSTEFFSPLSNSSQIIFASSCSRFNPLISLQIQRSLSLSKLLHISCDSHSCSSLNGMSVWRISNLKDETRQRISVLYSRSLVVAAFYEHLLLPSPCVSVLRRSLTKIYYFDENEWDFHLVRGTKAKQKIKKPCV